MWIHLFSKYSIKHFLTMGRDGWKLGERDHDRSFDSDICNGVHGPPNLYCDFYVLVDKAESEGGREIWQGESFQPAASVDNKQYMLHTEKSSPIGRENGFVIIREEYFTSRKELSVGDGLRLRRSKELTSEKHPLADEANMVIPFFR